jgi:hypothetical protein
MLPGFPDEAHRIGGEADGLRPAILEQTTRLISVLMIHDIAFTIDP